MNWTELIQLVGVPTIILLFFIDKFFGWLPKNGKNGVKEQLQVISSNHLNHILEESHVGAILYEDRIPISQAAVEISKKTRNTSIYHALSDGEDYELLFTLSKGQAKKVMQSSLFEKGIFNCIGEVVKGFGIQMKFSDGKIRRIKPRGYEHLKT